MNRCKAKKEKRGMTRVGGSYQSCDGIEGEEYDRMCRDKKERLWTLIYHSRIKNGVPRNWRDTRSGGCQKWRVPEVKGARSGGCQNGGTSDLEFLRLSPEKPSFRESLPRTPRVFLIATSGGKVNRLQLRPVLTKADRMGWNSRTQRLCRSHSLDNPF